MCRTKYCYGVCVEQIAVTLYVFFLQLFQCQHSLVRSSNWLSRTEDVFKYTKLVSQRK